MNYLAHLHLSSPEPDALVGNLMGDFRKHLLIQTLPESLQAGIRNHILVDRFTDNHYIINKLKEEFSPARRRFAGIILDVSFDYFLSRHWQRFNFQQRTEFIHTTYACLESRLHLMPVPMRQVIQVMIEQDWLDSYSDLTGIEFSLNRISRRIRFKNTLHGAIDEVHQNFEAIEESFLEFYPLLQQYMHKQVTWGHQD